MIGRRGTGKGRLGTKDEGEVRREVKRVLGYVEVRSAIVGFDGHWTSESASSQEG